MGNEERPGEVVPLSAPPLTAHGRSPRSEPFQQGPLYRDQLAPIGAFLTSFRGLRQRKISCGIDASGRSRAETTHSLRVVVDHQVTLISGGLGTVTGDRNRRRYPRSWQGSLVQWNAFSSDSGETTTSTTGTRLARATFQKGVRGM